MWRETLVNTSTGLPNSPCFVCIFAFPPVFVLTGLPCLCLHTGLSVSIFNDYNIFHYLRDVFQQPWIVVFSSVYCSSSFASFSTRLNLDWDWQFHVVCWKSCVGTEIVLWCQYNMKYLLKNILQAMRNVVNILNWLHETLK